MKNDQSIDLGLTGYEELFMSTEERLDAKKPKVEAIPLADLTPFRNHPFKVKEDEEMAQLIITMVDSNLQREHILPSEKAFAYKMKNGGIKKSRETHGFNFIASCDKVGCCSGNRKKRR